MENKFYMLMGLPGSGKSYISHNMKDVKSYSSDMIRKEIFGDENSQEDNNKVFSILHNRIIESLKEGSDCIYDATNINRDRRIEFLDKIKDIPCEKIAILMLTDYDVCLFNNKARKRNVPEKVIKDMYINFDIPQYREGWDEICIYSRFDGNKKYDIRDTIELLRREPHQDNHSKTIGNHICAVTNDVVKSCSKILPVSELWRLQEVSFYHDIGKLFCKNVNQDGIADYKGHENVSAYMYLLYKLFHEPEFNKEELLYRADLISLHMKPFDLKNKEDLKKMWEQIGEDKVMELSIINDSDSKF